MAKAHVRVTSREVARGLSDLLDRVADGEVIEVIDGRRRNARVRAYLVAALDKETS